VLGGLMMWYDQGFYDDKYKQKIDIGHMVPVSERMVADGFAALTELLPRESASRPYDLAQLSLIWPYNIVDHETKLMVLRNIETHLLGIHGVRRYPGDVYCGKGLSAHGGETAQWPLGLAWLAIDYAKMAEKEYDFDVGRQRIHLSWDRREEFFSRAVEYFARLERAMTPEGYVPEMYVGTQVGHNTPLAWAQSFHIIAAQCLLNLSFKHPDHFRIPVTLRRAALV